MKKVLTAILAAALCLLTLASCGNPGEFSDGERLSGKYQRNKDSAVTFHYADGATEPPESYANFANTATTFTLKAFRSRAAEADNSFVFSPVSPVLQLAMLSNAASPDTRQEILTALGSELGVDGLNACASYFKSRMESVSALNTDKTPQEHVALGGAVLIDDSIDVKSSFLQNVKDFYDYDVFRFDFEGEHADNKLKNYLKAGGSVDLSGGEINLISFEEISDSWLNAYRPSDISEGVFNGAAGQRKATFLASNETKVQSDKAVGIVKYTAKNPLKLILVQPKNGAALADYAKGFDSGEYETLLNSVDITKQTQAVIPAFSVEADKTAVPISGNLTKNGLYTLFTEKAGFSALSYTESAKMGEMFNIAPSFSLNQYGINYEAAAAAQEGERGKTEDEVKFDHPFLFILADNETNLPVLMGTYQ